MRKSDLRGASVSLVLAFAVFASVAACGGPTLFAMPAHRTESARLKPSATIITARIKAATARLTVKQGAYRLAEGTVYVGVEGEPPNHPTIQFYDEKTRRTGTLEHGSGQEYRSDGSPPMNFVLDSPVSSVVEKPIIIESGADRLGASLWHTPGAERRATIVLIHGADDEAREMGFLIPYFVSHGLNVVTYDQRGTGESTGNLQYTGPESKADDVVAILRKLEGIPQWTRGESAFGDSAMAGGLRRLSQP
ncbi:MAG: alpha/beta hydrolase, partial [Blastocatellia bacterium]